MARKVSTLPALIAIGGHPYMIDGGAPMDDGDPLRAFCPNGPHTLEDYDKGGAR